jgi:hypothetical protein
VEGRYVWVDNQPNILTPEYQEKIEAAFPRGIVFGHQAHWWYGNTASHWAFRDFNQFAEHLRQSRPGDKYEVWSLPDLIAKELVLAHGERSAENNQIPMPPERELRAVRSYLDVKYNEFFAIFAEAESNDLEIVLNDEDGYEDIISYIDGSDGWMFDEVWVLPYTDIEKPEHIYLQARYPNEHGEVPIWNGG